MSENGEKSRWVRISNLYKQHDPKFGTRLQGNNLAKRLDDDWEGKVKEDKNYVQLQVWDNKRKDGFLDNSEDAHLVLKRTELDDFMKYLEGLR